MSERTLILIKPDGVQRALVGRVIDRYESRGLRIAGLKLMQADRSLAERHYAVHAEKPFFAGLIEFITSGPLVAVAVEGPEAIAVCKAAGFDLVIVETAGIGQSDSEIVDLVDFPMYVMTSDFGAQSQLEKIDMLDFAELVVLNKYDKRGAEDALRDVRKQWKRNHNRFHVADEEVPVYPTIASQFNDPGVTWMFANLCKLLREKLQLPAERWAESDRNRIFKVHSHTQSLALVHFEDYRYETPEYRDLYAEFRDENGERVAWGHFSNVDEIRLPSRQ